MLTKRGSFSGGRWEKGPHPLLGWRGEGAGVVRDERNIRQMWSLHTNPDRPPNARCPGVSEAGEQKWFCARFLGQWALGPQKSSQVPRIQLPGDAERHGDAEGLRKLSQSPHAPSAETGPGLLVNKIKTRPRFYFSFAFPFWRGGSNHPGPSDTANKRTPDFTRAGTTWRPQLQVVVIFLLFNCCMREVNSE